MGLGIQFGHGDAHFWSYIPNLIHKPTFESQISNFQLLILIFSPKLLRESNKWELEEISTQNGPPRENNKIIVKIIK